MPTDTFMKLSEEKKQKVVKAAKKEFARVPFEETSIKNIVEEAGIARGSFYQYFESKEDLLTYIISAHIEKVNINVKKSINQTDGDIFVVFISIYDHMVTECITNGEIKFFKNIFENMRNNEERIFLQNPKKPEEMYKYSDIISKENLNIKNDEEFELIIEMLHAITRKAIIETFKYQSKEKARENYLKQLEFLKYGILKSKKEEKSC